MKQSLFKPYTLLSGLVDFLLNCAAILYATTLLSSNPVLLNLLLLVPAILTLLAPGSRRSQSPQARKPARKQDGSHSGTHSEPLPVKPFVTHYRGTMMVVTCAAILAVDFPVFPRRFAKVENWGTSLMDLGVGSFVFSAGTVAARPILKRQLAGRSQSLALGLKTAVRSALPLLVLGLIRFYSVKGLEYAEHVTEYGVHWNFFFTMAMTPLLVALFDTGLRYLPSYSVFAVLVGVAYQTLLDSTELTTFILTAPRTDLLSKNREGIFSSIGYLAIFLAGQGAGMHILPRYSQSSSALNDPVFQRLTIWGAVYCALYILCTDHRLGGLDVSRRMANLPYVLWIAAFNNCQILAFYLIEAYLFPGLYDSKLSKESKNKKQRDATSHILRSFNRNGLAIFLVANLLTGLVNLTLPTLQMGDLSAMAVLILYMGSVAGVAVVLDYMDISLKL